VVPPDNDHYLIANPPARRQFYTGRARGLKSVIVLHTAENALDVVGEDAGAENVAEFVRARTDQGGSYHAVVDSDSVVWLVPPTYTAFGARGYNADVLHVSFACRGTDWDIMPADRRAGFLEQGAWVAARYAVWLNGVVRDFPAPRILTKPEVDAGRSGFSFHRFLDPARRSDPGVSFPVEEFLEGYAAVLAGGQAPVASGDAGGRWVREFQRIVGVEVDGDFGPLTSAAADRVGLLSHRWRFTSVVAEQLVWSGELTELAQDRLNERFGAGLLVDGLFGDSTFEAVVEHVTPGGILGADEWRVLVGG